MVCRWALPAALLMFVVLASGSTAAAEPDAPRPEAACAGEVAGAMTWPAAAKTPLVCEAGNWATVSDPYPVSDKWVSFGPTMTLHGQGRRNPNVLDGEWTAIPLDGGTICRARQYAVIPNTPQVGEPTVEEAPAGEQLSFETVPRLFTIELAGDCLWEKIA